MKSRWNFQLCPNTPNVIGEGYRMDGVGEAVERQVNDALPGYLKFHGVNKIVVMLGPSAGNERDYVELLGVATKQWPAFDPKHYVTANESDKRQMLRECVIEVFAWLEGTFKDASFVDKTRLKVLWLAR